MNFFFDMAKEFDTLMRSEYRTPDVRNNFRTGVKNILDKNFSSLKCMDVVITENDGEFFGFRVYPYYFGDNLAHSIMDPEVPYDNPLSFRYSVDVDSKMLNGTVDPLELSTLLITEVNAFTSSEAISKVTELLDRILVGMDVTLDNEKARKCMPLFKFVLSECIYYLSSVMVKASYDNNLLGSAITFPYEEMCKNDMNISMSFESGIKKVKDMSQCIGEDITTLVGALLTSYLSMYRDIDKNKSVLVTLKDAKDIASSTLYKNAIQLVISDIEDKYFSGRKPIEDVPVAPMNESSIRQRLKASGLDAIEDDIYALTIRVKNLTDEDEAIMTSRLIGKHLSTIDGYMTDYQDTMTEREVKRCNDMQAKLTNLREEIVHSKIYKNKQYGLFIDYNNLESITRY